MKHPLLLLFILYLTASCNLSSEEVKQSKPDFSSFDEEKMNFKQEEAKWLKKLHEWGVSHYNDSAKWRIYCYYGDDTCKLGSENKPLPPIPLAFLELKLGFAGCKNNRLELLYHFLYDDSSMVRYSENRSKEVSSRFIRSLGVAFDVKADTVIGYTAGHATMSEHGPLVRYENFTHPDLIRFVVQNAHKLHPWFRKEAARRGLLTL